MTAVLFLTESYHPVLGGGEQHIRALSRRLVERGLEATVVTRRSEPDWPAEEVDGGVRVVRVGPSGPARVGKYAMVPQAVRAVLRERRRCDVLVVRGTRVLGLPGLMAGRWMGRPVVLQAEVNGEMSGEVYTWGTPLHRRPARDVVNLGVRARNVLLRDADAFVAMSRRIRDEFVEAGVEPHRVRWIPHGIDTAHFRPVDPATRRDLRRTLGLPADGLIVTYTGRLLRGKGLETLLDAFAALAASHPAIHLVLVGSGEGQALSVEPELRSDVERRGLAHRVSFTGRVPDVAGHLQASDVFAFPSVYEALGLSLVEAAACGLACVGARTGGIVDVIEEGRSGLLFAPGDVAALRAAMERLIADPRLRTTLGAGGRQAACARFDLGASVERYRALFMELPRPPHAACSPAGAPRAGEAPRR